MRSRKANKSSHSVKLTYADRVLCAVSLLQKKHKKRFVHPTTLRAQVRKNASERNDKLGPQWSSWVGRAVQDLESRGILQPAGTIGSVSLTPKAKKAVASAERELHTPNPTLLQEDKVWKSVGSGFSIKNIKRRRLDTDYEEDEDALDGLSDAASEGERTQKQRAKPVAHMTRAELQVALRSVKQAHTKDRATLNVVTRSLEQTSQELQDLKRDYQAMVDKTERPHTVDEVGNQADNGIGQHTPTTPTPRTRTQTPELPSLSLSTTQVQRPHGVTRTQSGSYISLFSKQPTPAPSEPEDREEEFSRVPDMGNDDDIFQDDRRSAVMETNGLFTPQTSPHQGHVQPPHKMSSFQTNLAKKSSEVAQTRKDLELERSKYQAACDRISALEGQNEEQLRTLSENDRSISARDAEISALKTLIEDKGIAFAHSQTVLQEQLDMRGRLVRDLEDRVDQAQNKASDADERASGLQRTGLELQSALDKNKTALVRCEETVSQLTGELAKTKEAEERYLGRISELETESRDLTSQVDSRSKEITEIRDTLTDTQKLEQSLAALIARTKEEQKQQTFIHGLRVAGLESALISAQREITSISDRFTDIHTAYHAERGHAATIQQELAALKESDAIELSSCQSEILSARSSLSSAQLEIDELKMNFRASEVAHEVAMQACNLRISSLQNYVSTCETQVTELQAAQDSTMSQLVQVTTQRDENCNEVATLQNELAVERGGTSALKENLDKALANHDKAEQDNLKLVEARQVNKESIRTLINNYAKLKAMQMGCFAEMDSVVASVHASGSA